MRGYFVASARLRPEPSSVEAARAAVERLANVQMSISLEEWSELSSTILAALPCSTGAGVVMPEEPDDLVTDAIREAWRETRTSGVSGMTIDAQWRSEFAREIAAYQAIRKALENGPAELADAHSKSPSRPAMPKEEDTHG